MLCWDREGGYHGARSVRTLFEGEGRAMNNDGRWQVYQAGECHVIGCTVYVQKMACVQKMQRAGPDALCFMSDHERERML